MSSRTEIWNGYEDALASELASGELTQMSVGAVPVGWAGPVYLCIEPDVPANREWIRANDVNVGLGRFENLTRNLEGSVGDLTHPANSVVRAIVTRQLTDDIFTDIEATELALTQHETDGGDPHSQAGYLKVGDTDALYLKLSGGTLTNFLTLHADPTADQHAATKSYVDDAVIDPTGLFLLLDGTSVMGGNIDMGVNRLVNMANGLTDTDGATTKQVSDSTSAASSALTQHENDAGDPHAAAGYLTESDADAVYLQLDGSVAMVGAIDMGSNPINLIADGTIDTDAVSKGQMDTAISAAVATALLDYDTAVVSDGKNDGKMESYYTADDDSRAVNGRRIFIQGASPTMVDGDFHLDTTA